MWCTPRCTPESRPERPLHAKGFSAAKKKTHPPAANPCGAVRGMHCCTHTKRGEPCTESSCAPRSWPQSSLLRSSSAAPLSAAPPGGTYYTVTPAGLGHPGRGAADRPDLVNGWGLARSATSPWWVADNGPEPSKSTLYTGAGAIGRAHGQRSAAARPAPSSPGSRAVPDRERRRARRWARRRFVFATEDGRDQRVARRLDAALVRSDDRYRRRRDLQGPRDRPADPRAARCSTRPTSTTRASTSSTAPGRTSRRRARSSTRACRAATRRSGSRRSARDVFVTYAKQDADADDEVARPGPRLRRRVRPARATCSAASRSAGSSNAPVGPRAGAGGVRPLRAATCSSATSATARSTPTTRRQRRLRTTTARCATPTAASSRSTGCGRSSSATPARTARPDTLFFTAGPDDESHGLFGTITTG